MNNKSNSIRRGLVLLTMALLATVALAPGASAVGEAGPCEVGASFDWPPTIYNPHVEVNLNGHPIHWVSVWGLYWHPSTHVDTSCIGQMDLRGP